MSEGAPGKLGVEVGDRLDWTGLGLTPMEIPLISTLFWKYTFGDVLIAWMYVFLSSDVLIIFCCTFL